MTPAFPGMNPFLEGPPYWVILHGWLVRELARLHIPEARTLGCEIDVERRLYQRDTSGRLMFVGEPDALAFPASEGIPVTGHSAGLSSESNVAVAEAVHEIVWGDDEEQPWQDYLVIREGRAFQRTLAVVELLSPANKDNREYAEVYREKVRPYESSQTSFMEIDLLRAGTNPSRDKFPELPPTPYFVFVDRKLGRSHHEEGYPVRLAEPLPTVNLPLGPGRPDLPLNLGAAWSAVMEICWRDRWLHEFDPDPPGPLSETDRDWVRQIMKSSSAST